MLPRWDRAFLGMTHLTALALRRPLDFFDWLITILEMLLDLSNQAPSTYRCSPELEDVLERLEAQLGVPVKNLLGEPPLLNIEAQVLRKIENLRGDGPFPLSHSADIALARLIYIVCRLMKPNIVLETGVAYGVTSAFILKALETNGMGFLHSVEIFPLRLGASSYVGHFIPDRLKRRWQLHWGASRRVLPRLLPRIGRVDLLLIDSLHTYRNMRRELRTAAPFLGRPATVVSDDIHGNSAFSEFVELSKPQLCMTGKQDHKPGVYGICIFLHEHAQTSAYNRGDRTVIQTSATRGPTT